MFVSITRTLPENPIITTKVKDTERSLKASTKGKTSNLTFSTIMEIAKEVQQQKSNLRMSCGPPQMICLTASNNLTRCRVNQEFFGPEINPIVLQNTTSRTFLKIILGKSQHQQKFRGVSQPRDTDSSPSECSFCGNSNHVRRDCWRENGLCLICGGQHFRKDCPNYDPAYRANNRSKSGGALNLPVSMRLWYQRDKNLLPHR